jgi:hypothetical protein
MAISIDWANKIIFVPKADMTLVQASPEIRQLDLNYFRLALKSLEGSEAGQLFDDTHRHFPPVTVGGVTISRVVEIINGYTVTFENGAYAVNLVGANSNVSDVTNVNNVSIRASNSAGLVDNSGVTDRVWHVADLVESGITPIEALRIISAALAGKLSGAPSGPIVIRNIGDTKTRITATVDSNGNRINVVTDGT